MRASSDTTWLLSSFLRSYRWATYFLSSAEVISESCISGLWRETGRGCVYGINAHWCWQWLQLAQVVWNAGGGMGHTIDDKSWLNDFGSIHNYLVEC